jgi:hypothetical protein
MSKILVASVAACIGLAGSGHLEGAGLLSATGIVIAILAGDLFVGEAEGHLSGAGTLAIRSQKASGLACVGEFTSSAKLGGSGQLRCTDGTTAIFHFRRLSMFSGHGAGNSSRGLMSFRVRAHRRRSRAVPEAARGQEELAQNGTDLELADLQERR